MYMHYLQATMYQIICTHKRLHSTKGNKKLASPGICLSIYMKKPRECHGTTVSDTTAEKYDTTGRGWYFQFDDGNKMSDKYILPVT